MLLRKVHDKLLIEFLFIMLGSKNAKLRKGDNFIFIIRCFIYELNIPIYLSFYPYVLCLCLGKY